MATRLGSGNFTYQVITDWAKLPEGWSFLEVVDVAVDSEDRVYVFCRGQHPLIISTPAGHLPAQALHRLKPQVLLALRKDDIQADHLGPFRL